MARLCRTIDWSATALGPTSSWAADLRVAVTTALDSPLPTIVLWGPDLLQIYNDAYRLVLGHRHPAAMGQPTRECWPEVWHFNAPIYRRVLETGEGTLLEDQEYAIAASGGTELHYFTISYAPARDESGTVRGVVVVPMETTWRVLAEREKLAMLNATRFAADQLRQMFDMAPSFMALLKGSDHILEIANAAFTRLLPRRDLVGKSVRLAIPSAESQGFVALLDDAYASGKPYLATAMPADFHDTPDGPATRRFLNFVFQPVKDSEGRVFAIFVEGSDVTEQHLAQLELTRINQQLRQIHHLEEVERRQAFQLKVADVLRRLSDPADIFQKTSELVGRHLNVSRAHYGDHNVETQEVSFHSSYTDGTVAELNGSFPSAAFGAENFAALEHGTTWVSDDLAQDARTAAPAIWRNLEALDVHSSVVVPLQRQGAMIASFFVNHRQPRPWSDEEVTLIEDVAGRAWSAVERARAERNQRHAEKKLREADRRKDEFLAMLAHELRNPLAPIVAAANLLSHPGMGTEDFREISDIIVRQAGHMTILIDDLLDVSRINKGLVTLDLQRIDIRDIATGAVEQIRPLMEQRRHDFQVRMTPGRMAVEGDRVRLVQILSNILSNAAKYTPEGGKISLTIGIAGKQVRLCVQDDGVGISPDLLPHVFDIFTQAERSADRRQGGLGLGLSLVKSLVDLHQGVVMAESEGLGLGSRFTVFLPLVEGVEQNAGPAPTPAATAARQPLHIMVVDDNVDAAKAVALLLKLDGHSVSVRHSAEDALASASSASQPTQAFLLDIGLPGMDGYELARQLRASSRTAGSMLVALTGYGQPQDREKSRAAGFDHHFEKPIASARLRALFDRPSAS